MRRRLVFGALCSEWLLRLGRGAIILRPGSTKRIKSCKKKDRDTVQYHLPP